MTYLLFFFLKDTAPTEIYTLSLHDALPISPPLRRRHHAGARPPRSHRRRRPARRAAHAGRGGLRRRHLRRPQSHLRRLPTALRSEEHTSELQSQSNLVCRLLLEKKKYNNSI